MLDLAKFLMISPDKGIIVAPVLAAEGASMVQRPGVRRFLDLSQDPSVIRILERLTGTQGDTVEGIVGHGHRQASG